MRRFISSLLIILMISAVTLSAVSANEEELLADGVFSYYIKDKSAVIASCNDDRTVITIPKTIGGYTVAAIEDGAFSLCKNVEYFRSSNRRFAVTDGALYSTEDKKLICYPSAKDTSNFHIPGFIKELASCAFLGNEHINKVYLNNNISSIPAECFAGCTALNTVNLGNNITVIEDGAFAFCSSLKDITLPEELTSIGVASFYGCSLLKSVNLGDNLTKIGEMAFKDCTSINKIHIPKGIDSIENWIFSISPDLEEITVSRDNESFVVSDDIVYTKDKNTLVFCPPASNTKELVIDDGTIIIGRNAFENHKTLKKITLPDTVTEIGANAFYNVATLEEIELSPNISKIGDYAFFGCSELGKTKLTATTENIGIGAFDNCGKINLLVADGSTAHSYALSRSISFEIDPEQPAVPKTYWADKYITWAEENKITYGVTDYKTALTRQGFCHIIVNFYEKYLGKRVKLPENPFTDTESEAVLKAYALGFMNGMGDGKFKPANSITRQELCVTICNIITVLNGEAPKTGDPVIFRDQDKIAPWANDYIITAYNNDIITGRSDGRIDPTGTASIEEALAMLYNSLPLIEISDK